MGYANIKVIEGNIDDTLVEFCQQFTDKIDLAFIDANHQYYSTLAYFNHLLPICHVKSLIIIDDIYWSVEMSTAWKQIKEHPQVTTTIDFYHFGIVFFRPELQNDHIRLMI
jgi:predicted O-methyltransferase YrrM